MDRIFRDFRKFAQTYINDIVVISKVFEEHTQHLCLVFDKPLHRQIYLISKKSFLNYPSLKFLSQRVDAIELASGSEKLAANARLRFPRNLKQLEFYLGFTSWLWQFIPNYAQLAA